MGTMLCKHGGMEGEIGERAMKGRSVVGLLVRATKGRNVSMDVKRGLRNSILLTTLIYGSESWTQSKVQQLRMHAIEMNYLREACGANRWDGVSNESVYE